MIGIPEPAEAVPYYATYIQYVTSGDILGVLETQLADALTFFRSISDEKSLHRYAADKWTIREALNHITDAERVFSHRAMWFARKFDTPLPSFDQGIAVAASHANEIAWPSHIEEFRAVRLATLALFRNLPREAWMRSGTASGNPFTVRALAYIVAGHLAHHRKILEERYL
jgi:uncharacterized damage-inducible protein DinB